MRRYRVPEDEPIMSFYGIMGGRLLGIHGRRCVWVLGLVVGVRKLLLCLLWRARAEDHWSVSFVVAHFPVVKAGEPSQY